MFSGFNQFKGIVFFGAALLYDETIPSFKWLFETFLEAHSQKRPRSIFTDQDAAMAKALNEVMPDVWHGLCTWHLNQNGIRDLGNMMKDGSQFLRDLKYCMYNIIEKEHFELAWRKLLLDYNVENNTWLTNLYRLKEKWAACYMKSAFTLGMRSTQITECINSYLKTCLSPNIDLLQFFKKFERVVEDKRYNELKEEFKWRNTVPRVVYTMSPILKQAAQVYSLKAFEIFEAQFNLFLACSIKHRAESEVCFEYGVVVINKEGEFKVSFRHVEQEICCSCKMFDNVGILCGHALKVLDANEVKTLPAQYILKRWTKVAKNGVIEDVRGKEVVEDPKLTRTQRYRDTCSDVIKLVAEVVESDQEYLLFNNFMREVKRQLVELRRMTNEVESVSDDPIPPMDEGSSQPKGIKKRLGTKRMRRLKNWVEVQPDTKRKKDSSVSNS